VRFSDVVLRRGHLSEDALAEVWMTGHRPAHLDTCERCDRRANHMGLWLSDVKSMGLESGDAAFPAERLAAQHSQILRRLEQVDNPARVISFPQHVRPEPARRTKRRIAPGWVGIAAAAGIVLGVVGEQVLVQFNRQAIVNVPAPTPSVPQNAAVAPAAAASLSDADLLESDFTQSHSQTLGAIESMTPTPATVVSRK